ncbi:MAG: hypothetical protein JNM41_04410 [Flavipsychrobacter sp.]|nr:hypothetical protein [Flavipsychrobacter sp.]
MIGTEIVNIALENLQQNTKITGVWKGHVHKKDHGIDGEIIFNINDRKFRIFAEVKKGLRNHQLYQIKELANAYKPFLIVAEHIFPKIKEELRKNGIAYLEANGNVYLNEPGMYLWIDNQKPIPQEKEQVNRAFTKTGLKAIFHFLLNEEIVNYPYRNIAQMAEIGLGNVNNVMNGLKQAGFLLKKNKDEYKLVNKKELLEKWIVAYEEKLKPTLHIGNFRFLNEEDHKNWKFLPVAPGKTFWGAEPAADLLTNYLRPEILTLYTEENRNELIKHYRLIPDEKGKVKVYKKFWTDTNTADNTADPILVYADLMNTGNGRCMEAAQKIKNEFLQDKL